MEIINVDYIEEVCGGSKEIIKEMVDIFRQQIPEFCNEMKSLLDSGQNYNLGLLAHKAKSSVAIMGMQDLADKLKELEHKAKKGEEAESYSEYIEAFKRDTSLALKELDDYIKNI